MMRRKFLLATVFSLVFTLACLTGCGSGTGQHIHSWSNGICSGCGESVWTDGVCSCCGEEHSHIFGQDSICGVCKYECRHESHDVLTLACNKCDNAIPHTFDENGLCVKCEDITDIYITGSVDDLFVKEIDQKGKVEQLSYECTALAGAQKGQKITKKLNVYLPYGYTAGKKYNVLYYLHGAFSTINEIINPDQYTDTQKALDNMIKEEVFEPVILVAPTWFDPDKSDATGVLGEEFNTQLRENIIPLVESKYSTYLDCNLDITNVTAEKIAKSRDHRAIAGFSGGASVAQAMAVSGLDMFGYFGAYSNTYNPDKIVKGINSDEFAGYDVKYMFNTIGSAEREEQPGLMSACVDNYRKMKELNDKKLVDGENMRFVTLYGLVHDLENIRSALYNSLANHFFIADEEDEIDFSKAIAVAGELTGTVTAQFGDYVYTLTLGDDLTARLHINFVNFISQYDNGTYVLNKDGTITVTFTKFEGGQMGGGDVTHSDTFLIEKQGKKWAMRYVYKDNDVTVKGKLSAVYA